MTASKSPLSLVRFDPDSPTHVAELRRERVLCGWGSEDVDNWLKTTKSGDKELFWLFPVVPEDFPMPETENIMIPPFGEGPARPTESFAPLGHIALEWVDYRNDTSLACREENRCTIATFFILGSQQGRGLGNHAMKALEDRARSQGAKTITLNTLHPKYVDDPSAQQVIGWVPDAKTRKNSAWYEKLGYVKYKEEGRYPWTVPTTGEEIQLDAVFMKKSL